MTDEKTDAEVADKPGEKDVDVDTDHLLQLFLDANPYTRKKTKYLVTALLFLIGLVISLPLIANGFAEYSEANTAKDHAGEQHDLCILHNLTQLEGMTCTEWQEKSDLEGNRSTEAFTRALVGIGGLSISLVVSTGLLITHIKSDSIASDRREKVKKLVDRLRRKEIVPVAKLAESLEMKAEIIEVLIKELNEDKILHCEIKDAVVLPLPVKTTEEEVEPVEKE
jgi:hypothetical protein